MLQQLKKLFKGFMLSLAVTFGKKDAVKVPENTAISGEKEPVQEMDEWGRLIRDMESPDYATREKAQAVWADKKSRDAAFFSGMNFETKPVEERGKPMETRNGWRPSEYDILPEDDWADDREWRMELNGKTRRLQEDDGEIESTFDYDAYLKDQQELDYRDTSEDVLAKSADELDRGFYNVNPGNISKDELEETTNEYRKRRESELGEG